MTPDSLVPAWQAFLSFYLLEMNCGAALEIWDLDPNVPIEIRDLGLEKQQGHLTFATSWLFNLFFRL